MPHSAQMIERTLRENAEIVGRLLPRPQRALEVGALPSRYSILSTPEAADIPERLAINLTEQGEAPNGVQVKIGDARAMSYPDGYFDLVISNAMLEHVPDFWRAVDEMKRVLAPGGHLVLGAPGYIRLRGETRMNRVGFRLRLPDLIKRGTVTMRMHDKKDYYRFSPDTFREVLMAGMQDVEVWSILVPPRLYAVGRKPIDGRLAIDS